MVNRSRALQVAQIGLEATPGTEVPANLIAPNTKIMVAPAGDPNTEHVPSGHLVARDTNSGMTWGAGSYEMKIAYDESYLMFNSFLRHVDSTGATLAKTRVWTPSPNAIDAFDTYSAQAGQAGAVEKFRHLLFNSLNFTIGKQESPLFTGEILAQGYTLAAALTATPTVLESSPIASTSWNLWTGATFGAMTTQLLTGFRVAISVGPKYSTAAFVGSANPSWDAAGIGDPIPNSVNVVVPFDVSGTDYAGEFTMAKKAAGTPIFLTAISEGAVIESAVQQTLKVAMCLKIRNVPAREDIGPFVGNSWPCGLYIDSVSNKWLEVTTISETA